MPMRRCNGRDRHRHNQSGEDGAAKNEPTVGMIGSASPGT